MMNCKLVQELLPLHVGHDLEEKRALLVAAHLQSCAQCAGLADEYREARQLLQQFAPPQFGEAVYTGIRQGVLREIEPEPTTPGLSRLLGSLFPSRLRWAVATALLLVVCLFAFYFIAKRPNDRRGEQQVADSGNTAGRPTSSSIKESAGLPPASTAKNRDSAKGLPGGVHLSQRRTGIEGARVRTRPPKANNADTESMTAAASAGRNNLAQPDAVPARDSASSEKTLRVEMQTKDPNIRIIWFAPQPTKQDSPSKSSKGT